MSTRDLVETELARRGLSFATDLRSGGYVVATPQGPVAISIDNLDRQVARDVTAAPQIVADFLDAAFSAGPELSAHELCWLLEPNDYRDPSSFREPVSPGLDRVLAHVPSDFSRATWIRASDLATLGLSTEDAALEGFATLDRLVRASTVQTQDLDGAATALILTTFPWKASLLLAPALRSAVADQIGWPVLAIAPDRDFVILWNADRRDLIARIGPIVAREFGSAPYPLSMEVFEIDEALRAIGRIATGDQ